MKKNCQLSTVTCQLLLLLAAGVTFSCSDFDDNYSSNPAHRLSFSADTLSFDSIFTTVRSSTREFMVYNRNKEPLNIASVKLAGGNAKGFRINVDGRSGEAFSDIPIRAKDSLFVFVEARIDPTGYDEPVEVEDKLEFTVNGTTQSILLAARAQDANMITGGLFINGDTTFTAERPYVVYDSIVVEKGATLTLEEGTSFYMYNKAKWRIEGTLLATGSLAKPIILRGDRLDRYSTTIPYDRLSGQWNGIFFGAESFGNVMDYVEVRNGSRGLTFAQSSPEQPKIKINNSRVTNMDTWLLYAVNCDIEAVNSEFSNAQDSTVFLEGGTYHFIHCTLVNYYVFTPGRMGENLLTISNTHPINATFDNCIIDGSFSDELSILEEGDAAPVYRFNHCLIKTADSKPEGRAQYKSIGNSENGYLYDYRLEQTQTNGTPAADQPAIGKADPEIAAQYPLDRMGINRATSADGPDIGAYEYVPEPEEKE